MSDASVGRADAHYAYAMTNVRLKGKSTLPSCRISWASRTRSRSRVENDRRSGSASRARRNGRQPVLDILFAFSA